MNLRIGHAVSLAFTIFLSLGFVSVKAADGDDRFGLIRYDTLSGFSLGDGVAFDDPSQPLGNCIDLEASKIKQDTPGVASITAQIDVVSDARELEDSLKTSLIVEANAEIGIEKIGSGKLETSTTRKYEKLLKEKNSTLVVRILLSSDKGRDVLDYRLREEYKTLLNGDDSQQDEFVERCGTHFIRAVQKGASLSVDLVVSNLSKSSKELLSETAKKTLSGKGAYKGVSLGGKKANQETLDRFETLATQLGAVSITMEGRGAPGLEALAPVLYQADGTAASLSQYLDKIKEVVSAFKAEQSAPEYYITQKYPGIANRYFDTTKALYLDALLRRIIAAESALASYARFKKDDPGFWEAHVKGPEAVTSRSHNNLKRVLRKCVDEDACQLRVTEIPTLVSKSDLLERGRLGVVCGTDITFQDGASSFAVMSDMALVWRGEIRYPNFVALDAVKAFAIASDGKRRDLEGFVAARDFSVDPVALKTPKEPDRIGPGRAISQIVNTKLAHEKVIKDDRINLPFLQRTRENLGAEVYGLTFNYRTNNEIYDVVLGRADLSQCILKTQVPS